MQTFDVRNTSVGSVTVTPTLLTQGNTPDAAAKAVVVDDAVTGTAIPAAGISLKPQERRAIRLATATDRPTRAGAQTLRLDLAVAEAGEAAPITRTVTVPLKLNVRYPAIWAVVALLLGWFVGRLLLLINDPAYAARLDFFGQIRDLGVRVGDLSPGQAKVVLLTRLDRLRSDLEHATAVTQPMKDTLEELAWRVSMLLALAAARPASPPANVANAFEHCRGQRAVPGRRLRPTRITRPALNALAVAALNPLAVFAAGTSAGSGRAGACCPRPDR